MGIDVFDFMAGIKKLFAKEEIVSESLAQFKKEKWQEQERRKYHKLLVETRKKSLIEMSKQRLIAIHLEDLNYEYRDDRDFMFELCKQNGVYLLFASKRLCDDEELVKLATKNCDGLLSPISKRLRGNKEIMILAIEKNPSDYQYVSEELRNDTDILSAIERGKKYCRYTSELKRKQYANDLISN